MNTKMLKLTKVTLAGGLIISSIGLTGLESQAAAKKKIVVAKKSSVVVKKNKLRDKKTGKLMKKYVLYQSKLYKNGVLFAGVVNGIKYAKGKKLNGVVKNVYYKAGKKATGTAKNGKYYYKGVLAKGLVAKKFYVNGKKGTGIAKNGKLYVKGVVNKGAYYYVAKKKWYAGPSLDVAKNTAVAKYLAAKNLSKSKYTVESWNTFISLVAANEVSTTSKAVTVTQLNEATVAFKQAAGDLILKTTSATDTEVILAVRKALAALSAKSTLDEIRAVEVLYNKLSTTNRTQISLQLVENFKEYKAKAEQVASTPEKEKEAADKKITDSLAKVVSLTFGVDEEVTAATIKAKLPVIDGITYTVRQGEGTDKWIITIKDSAGKGTSQTKEITVTIKEETAEQLANKAITEAFDKVVDLTIASNEILNAELIKGKLPVVAGITYKVEQVGTSNEWKITIQDSGSKGTAKIKTIKVTAKDKTKEELAKELIEEALIRVGDVNFGFKEEVTESAVKSKIPVIDGIKYTLKRIDTSDEWEVTIQDTLGNAAAKTKHIKVVKNPATDVELANDAIAKALGKVSNVELDYKEKVTAEAIKAKLLVESGITYTVTATAEQDKWKVTIQDNAEKGTAVEKVITVSNKPASPAQQANEKISEEIAKIVDVQIDYGKQITADEIKANLVKNSEFIYDVTSAGSGNSWIVTVQDTQKRGTAQSKTINVTIKDATQEQKDAELAAAANKAITDALGRIGAIVLGNDEDIDSSVIITKLPVNTAVEYIVEVHEGTLNEWKVTVRYKDKNGKTTDGSKIITVTKTSKSAITLANEEITAALGVIGDVEIDYETPVTAASVQAKLPLNSKVKYTVVPSAIAGKWDVIVQDVAGKGTITPNSKVITASVKAPTEAQLANKKITDAIGNVKNLELGIGKTATEATILAQLAKVEGVTYKATQASTPGKWIITVQDAGGKGTPQAKEITVTVKKSSDTTLSELPNNATIDGAFIKIPSRKIVLVADLKPTYEKATVKVTGKDGVVKTVGELKQGDSIVVTAEDGSTKQYSVNQEVIISSDTRLSISLGTLVTPTLLGNSFKISSGQQVSIASLKGMDERATIKVLDGWGNEVTKGNLSSTHKIVVTAENKDTKKYEVDTVYGLLGIPEELKIMPDLGVVYLGGIEITIALTTTVKVESLRPTKSSTKITVFDLDGNVKTSGNLTKEDTVLAEAADGGYGLFSVKDQNK